MGDTRYRDRGYSAEFVEAEYGALVTIKRNGQIVGEMAFSFFNSENLPTVHVKHFKPNQFGKTEETEDFSGESS